MTSTYQEYYSEYTQNTSKKSGPLPFGLHNMATSNQTRPEGFLDPVLRMPLKGAQEGLVLTITSQDCIVHWPGTIPEDDGTQLVDDTTTKTLPYQEGDSIYDLETSTEVINSSSSTEINDDDRTTHAREVFMIRCPRSPLAPQKHSTSGHQTNLNPIYHPLSKGTMVRPKIKSKPEKEKTN